MTVLKSKSSLYRFPLDEPVRAGVRGKSVRARSTKKCLFYI